MKGFPPVVDAEVVTLILGSFPGVASLGKRQYYGHPQNQFWRLLAAVIGEPLPALSYEARKRALLKHHIGLWDVIDVCEREGSLDSNIRNARHNEYSRVTGIAPRLRRVCFNGKTAALQQRAFSEMGYETIVLPSSSPAYTLAFELKLAQWRQIATPPVAAERAVTRRQRPGFSGLPFTPHAARG